MTVRPGTPPVAPPEHSRDVRPDLLVGLHSGTDSYILPDLVEVERLRSDNGFVQDLKK
jgi:hypothetical protein